MLSQSSSVPIRNFAYFVFYVYGICSRNRDKEEYNQIKEWASFEVEHTFILSVSFFGCVQSQGSCLTILVNLDNVYLYFYSQQLYSNQEVCVSKFETRTRGELSVRYRNMFALYLTDFVVLVLIHRLCIFE